MDETDEDGVGEGLLDTSLDGESEADRLAESSSDIEPVGVEVSDMEGLALSVDVTSSDSDTELTIEAVRTVVLTENVRETSEDRDFDNEYELVMVGLSLTESDWECAALSLSVMVIDVDGDGVAVLSCDTDDVSSPVSDLVAVPLNESDFESSSLALAVIIWLSEPRVGEVLPVTSPETDTVCAPLSETDIVWEFERVRTSLTEKVSEIDSETLAENVLVPVSVLVTTFDGECVGVGITVALFDANDVSVSVFVASSVGDGVGNNVIVSEKKFVVETEIDTVG